mgnify:CR=1 FL=1
MASLLKTHIFLSTIENLVQNISKKKTRSYGQISNFYPILVQNWSQNSNFWSKIGPKSPIFGQKSKF